MCINSFVVFDPSFKQVLLFFNSNQIYRMLSRESTTFCHIELSSFERFCMYFETTQNVRCFPVYQEQLNKYLEMQETVESNLPWKWYLDGTSPSA